MDVDLRRRQPSDEGLLLRLFLEARPELAAMPLPAEMRDDLVALQWRAQDEQHRHRFPGAEDSIVTVDGTPVGRLMLFVTDSEMRVVDLALAPEARGQGIGTTLVQMVLSRARRLGVPVRLSAVAHSRAVALYRRLGFQPAVDTADQAVYIEMEVVPPTAHR